MNKYKTWNTVTNREAAINLIVPNLSPKSKQLPEDVFIVDFMEGIKNKVLDFGSGLGRNTFLLARNYDNVWAYDFPNMLELLKKDSRFSGVSNITTNSDWATVKQEKFDAIICCISLQHIDRPELVSYLSDFAEITDNLYVQTRPFIDFSGELIYPILMDKWRIKRIYGGMTEETIKACKKGEDEPHYLVHLEPKKSNCMKTITFPVGYRPHYLSQFLTCLGEQNLSGYTIFCSAENSPECIKILQTSDIDLNILYKSNSVGQPSHSGARDNMFNVLNAAFTAGSTFNLHLEDDFLLSPDIIDLANWYYETYKNKPLAYMAYGMFGFNPRGDDYTVLEEVPFFEGLGWCAFKENWELCYKPSWYDEVLVKKYFNAYGWDWSVQAFFKEYKCKALRPLINRTQHNGRIGGTCCTIQHHDKHYVPLKWNKTERVTEFKIIGKSEETEEWIK